MFDIVYDTHNKFREDGFTWAYVKVFRANWNDKYNYKIENCVMLNYLANEVKMICDSRFWFLEAKTSENEDLTYQRPWYPRGKK